MESKSLKCNYCQEDYDLKDHLPRILIECGHSICELCLIEYYDKAVPIKCEICSEKIKTENVEFETFVKNYSLI